MSDELQDKVTRLVAETADLAQALRPLWESWRSGNRSLAQVAQAIEGHVKAYVEIAGELWPAIEDREERPKVIKAAVLAGMDLAGVDLPGPDSAWVEAVIVAATWAWRAARARRDAGAAA